jgi:thiamine-phosphate pyrophosphorylase
MVKGPRDRIAEGGGLYLVLSEPAGGHAALVEAAVERAVPMLQLREKGLSDDDLAELARALVLVTRGSDTLLIINDRPAVAAAVGADGVHVGRADADPESARGVVGPDAIVGASASTPEEIEAAARAGCDYVGAGPVYPTTTKPDARRPIGLDGVRAAAGAAGTLPIVAIGGITRGNAPGVLAAGADYVAVVSAICHADDPIAALDDFLGAISKSTA